jgi:hypothetical protein
MHNIKYVSCTFSSYVRSDSFSKNNFVTEFTSFICFKLSHVKRSKDVISSFNTVSTLAIKEGTLTVVNLEGSGTGLNVYCISLAI